jgi:hypothetical protein
MYIKVKYLTYIHITYDIIIIIVITGITQAISITILLTTVWIIGTVILIIEK